MSKADRRADKPRQPGPPDEAALNAIIGKARSHWDALLAAAQRADRSCRAEWVYYTSLKGWRCIVKCGGRTLVHLRPDDGGFLASFALSDGALDAAAGLGVPTAIVAQARAGKSLPEGRPIRVEVKTADDLRVAVGLLRAKAGAVG